jgi:hypothetical protein
MGISSIADPGRLARMSLTHAAENHLAREATLRILAILFAVPVRAAALHR